MRDVVVVASAITTAMLVSSCASVGPGPARRPETTAEQTDYRRTGSYREAMDLCDAFRRYPGARCIQIGETMEHRKLVAIRYAPEGKPLVYVQAGIHAGEIEGKDAGIAFFRDLLEGKVVPGALGNVGFVFVPVLNPDGHERFGPNNRPNQRGPEQMGFRTNGARLNLNRDFIKADAPETQAVLTIIAKDDPVLVVDLHTTDGAKFQQDISITMGPTAPRPDKLDQVAKSLSDVMMKRLTELGNLPVDFYPSFLEEDDPRSGFFRGEPPPRFSQAYAAARDRLGMLVETHSWRTYKERAQSTYHALQAIFEEAVRNGTTWRAREADAATATNALAGTSVALTFDKGPAHHDIQFKGYAYTKTPSELSGTDWIQYDETKPELWTVPLYDDNVPKISATAPEAGYIVDGGFAPIVAAVLDRHGLRWQRIDDRNGSKSVDVEVFRASDVKYEHPFEGRIRSSFTGAWTKEKRTLDVGAIFIPAKDNHLRLLMHILDPAAPDSLAQWGELDTAFEPKEYMERYVAEDEARKMIQKNPALADEFKAALEHDPVMAKSPDQRLRWFYRKHPAWDERLGLLPVYRTNVIP